MVSYYNSFAMYQKSTNLSYTPSAHAWYSSNYHTPGAQFLAATGDSSPQQLYYPHVFHQPSPDWTAHENFTPAGPPGQSTYLQSSLGLMGNHHHHNNPESLVNHNGNHPNNGGGGGSGGSLGGGSTTSNGSSGILQNIPTPPITIIGSDIPTPASSAPTASISPPTPVKTTQSKSPYEWMKKTTYQNQPAPGKFWHFNTYSNTLLN